MNASDRTLDWDGCCNVRDLGGLPTRDGRRIRWGALVRGDHPSKLSEAGWESLVGHGIRTIIELCSYGEERKLADAAPRPAELTTVPVEIEDVTDGEFRRRWIETDLWGTSLYFADALARWPARHARFVEVFADAGPGGVFVHCVRGFDRTGIATLLLLSLAGVSAEVIAADYALSDANMPEESQARLRELLNRCGGEITDGIYAALEGFDAVAYLRSAGVEGATLSRALERLVE